MEKEKKDKSVMMGISGNEQKALDLIGGLAIVDADGDEDPVFMCLSTGRKKRSCIDHVRQVNRMDRG
ncbi:hypothetical protein D0469_02440 [Peribacillus saganii]|uniref:Uncharacterized protein n=1 Tax=Peribacillus saganii TaxID=2303992 RepID=A0A372LTW5_9BACI|nr:hypothetical protein [Peribacillus saganii]RFU71252.1 hypothetical protein D0469_02440 [Peribacillus saganii]